MQPGGLQVNRLLQKLLGLGGVAGGEVGAAGQDVERRGWRASLHRLVYGLNGVLLPPGAETGADQALQRFHVAGRRGGRLGVGRPRGVQPSGHGMLRGHQVQHGRGLGNCF